MTVWCFLREVNIVPIWVWPSWELPAKASRSFSWVVLTLLLSQKPYPLHWERPFMTQFDCWFWYEFICPPLWACIISDQCPCRCALWLIHSDPLLALPSLSCYFTTAEPSRHPRPNSKTADSLFFFYFLFFGGFFCFFFRASVKIPL